MEVKIKDRAKEVEYLRMALNMCELGVSYEQTDLIRRVITKVDELNGDFSLQNGIELLQKWQHDWQVYADNQTIKKQKPA